MSKTKNELTIPIESLLTTGDLTITGARRKELVMALLTYQVQKQRYPNTMQRAGSLGKAAENVIQKVWEIMQVE